MSARPHVSARVLALVVAPALLAAGALAAAAAPIRRADAVTPNACRYSLDGLYRDQPVTLGGHGSPVDAPVGSTVTLSGASLSATLPAFVAPTGYELGVLVKGLNLIPARVWVAVAGTGVAPAAQVFPLTVTAWTRIATKADGSFASATPIVVTIPLPDSTWTVTGPGPVSFAQAAPGSLPRLPVGVDDAAATVAGSIVVAPRLANLRFVMDCQQGVGSRDGRTLTPGVAAAFATLDSAAPLPPVAAPAVPEPPPRVASARLKAAGGRVGVAVACPAATVCEGTIAVRSAAPVRVGARTRIVVVASGRYAVAAGRRSTVSLPLTAAARAVLRTRATLKARVTLDPAAGENVTRDLVLAR